MTKTVKFEELIGPLFQHACSLLEGSAYFQPTVLAFTRDGPGVMRSFGLCKPGEDAELAAQHIASAGGDWVGYLYVHASLLPFSGKEAWAVVLEAVHDGCNSMALIRRYEILDDQGRFTFVDDQPLRGAQPPPDRRLSSLKQ